MCHFQFCHCKDRLGDGFGVSGHGLGLSSHGLGLWSKQVHGVPVAPAVVALTKHHHHHRNAMQYWRFFTGSTPGPPLLARSTGPHQQPVCHHLVQANELCASRSQQDDKMICVSGHKNKSAHHSASQKASSSSFVHCAY